MLTVASCVNISLQPSPPALFIRPKRSPRGLSSGGYTFKGLIGKRLSVGEEKLKIKIFPSTPGRRQEVSCWPADTLVAMVVMKTRGRGDQVAVSTATAVVEFQRPGRWASVGGGGVIHHKNRSV